MDDELMQWVEEPKRHLEGGEEGHGARGVFEIYLIAMKMFDRRQCEDRLREAEMGGKG